MKRIAFITAALLASAPVVAFADPPKPRTIDMSTVITDLHGKPVPDTSQATKEDPNCAKCAPLTLGELCATGLLTPSDSNKNLSAIEKAKRGALALKLANAHQVALTAAEVTEIMDAIKYMPPMLMVRAVPLLDPAVDLNDK